MGGIRRHNSPTGVEPSSPKVGFAGVTGYSRPVTNDEQWTMYYFEAHAAQCQACEDPLRVSKEGRRLCDEGFRLAVDVATYLYCLSNNEVYSRQQENGRDVRVECPRDYLQSISLLKAINRAVRKGDCFLPKPKSHDKNYPVESRPTSSHKKEEVRPRPRYETKIVEPKSPRPKQKPRRRERESTDDLIADSKRGSLYDWDMAEREKAERREQKVRYNVEVREPKPDRRFYP